MSKVYSIVVTYNGEKWIRKCLDSLENSSVKTTIIIIDNNSSDETTTIIEDNYPEAELIKSNVNLGFGQANNLGLKKVLDENADYAFLLNQDAWLNSSDTLEKLIHCYENIGDKQYGIVCPTHLYGSGDRVIYGKNYMVTANNRENDLFSDLMLNKPTKQFYELTYGCAASWLIPLNTIKTIGGFDPIFFHYGEDDNYMQRMLYHGLKLALCINASICHDIEYRSIDYGKENNTIEKNILLEAADINNPGNCMRLKRHAVYRFIQQFIFFRIKSAKKHFTLYFFLVKNKKAILSSKEQNKKIGENWIY